MLVLARRVGEVLLIGENIEIIVTEIKGSQVRIGVKAPRDILILRKEVADRDAADEP